MAPITRRIVEGTPWYMRVGNFMARRGYPGAWRYKGVIEKLGLMNVIARYEVTGPHGSTILETPLYNSSAAFDQWDMENYESSVIRAMQLSAKAMGGDVCLIDCGAQIGLISARACVHCPEIKEVVSFEPNAEYYEFLVKNLGRLQVTSRSFQAAVADYRGHARLLRLPAYGDAGNYIELADDGPIVVMRIDDLDLPTGSHLILKLDVEGGEYAAVSGARRTISEAEEFTLIAELHPAVIKRTGIHPFEIVSLLYDIRPCFVRIAERPTVVVPRDRDGFCSLIGKINENLICSSLEF